MWTQNKKCVMVLDEELPLGMLANTTGSKCRGKRVYLLRHWDLR